MVHQHLLDIFFLLGLVGREALAAREGEEASRAEDMLLNICPTCAE